MALKSYKPTTPGQRGLVLIDRSDLFKGRPVKSLTEGLTKTGGRNNTGRITMWHKGGGAKRLYRVVDFKRTKFDMPAVVERIEYDPNRTAFIALLVYADGEKRYIIAPNGLQVGQTVYSGSGIAPEVGNAMKLGEMPLGTIVHNIELRPGQGGIIARSAGAFAQLAARDGKYAVLRMPSGESRMILTECMATVGTVSNADHAQVDSGKAGRSRWLGRRPRNRGVAMNPVDHPMGGGEGRASGGHPRSRNSIPSKGYKTRRGKRPSDRLIIKRRTN